MSNHPVHLVSREGSMMPSALVPFCAVGGKFLGVSVADLTVPVCDLFQPTLLGEHSVSMSGNFTNGRRRRGVTDYT